MIRSVFLILSLSLSIVTNSFGAAGRFSKLDEKFLKRGELSYSELTSLRGLYKKLIKRSSVSADDKLYGITQMARIDIYRGGILPNLREISIDKQKAAMDACIEDVKTIKDSDSPQYYYLYLACVGFRGKLEGMLGRVKYGLMMRRTQEAAVRASTRNFGGFEGGGINRVMSAVRGNRKAKPLGLYDAAEAVSFAEKALATPAAAYAPFTQELTGEDFFENHFYLAQSTIALGIENNDINKVFEGNGILISKIKKIDLLNKVNKLGERKPETLGYQKLMKNLNGHVEACKSESDWSSCLSDRLSDN